MRDKTDGGHKIDEADLEEMQRDQESQGAEGEPRELPEGMGPQTGTCRFCGQLGQVNALSEWTQEAVDEEVTCLCECEAAKEYKKAKERKTKAKGRITELFGPGAEKPVALAVVDILLSTVDAIEERSMKGITVDVGQGIRAKVAKMAKESIKVERSENKKQTYEE